LLPSQGEGFTRGLYDQTVEAEGVNQMNLHLWFRLKSHVQSVYSFSANLIARELVRVAYQLNEWRRTYWHRLYSFASYSKSALWIIPLIAIPIVLVLSRVVLRIDPWLDWKFFSLSLAGAQTLYQTVITLTVSFIVFTFSSLLVAIQVASGQMTPRVIATMLLRDNTVRYTVGLFVFSLLFANNALIRTETTVHQLVTFITGFLALSCIAAFLFFIDYAARLLRPGSIVAKVAETGIAVIEAVYPFQDTSNGGSIEEEPRLGPPSRVIFHQGKSGILLAVNLHDLVSAARRSSGIVEFVPRVGDFVSTDDPLFRLYGSGSFDERKLRGAVAVGPERTMEQDPMFAFRILLDIALKALSKAINDPTTAILSIDQLHRLLRTVGKRKLSSEQVLDGEGQLRVIFRTPNWEDYVRLTFTELRFNGAESIQVVRRLRAMIEDLVKTLPEHRHSALHKELALLDLAIQKVYTLQEDLVLARIPDSQGLGGSARSKA
jgi:uncharacterized membrane protein